MVTIADTYHVPVLLHESIDGLNIQPGGIYVDVTFGGGGHSREILARLEGDAHLYGFDQDADAEANIPHDRRFTFVRSNFRYLRNWMRYYGVERIDGLLADLGVSSHHLDDASRGFSFRFDAPLDMRMNKRAGVSAADVVNDYEEGRLADVFYLYGELRDSRRIASAIVECRKRQFQALRIEVNHEMDALKEMLQSATEVLRPGGRLAVITYHSLEDRIVKNVMKTGNCEGKALKDFYGRVETPERFLWQGGNAI